MLVPVFRMGAFFFFGRIRCYPNSAAAARTRLQKASDFFRHHERRPVASIAVAQQPLRFFIADNLLRVWIEVYRSAQPIGRIREVYKRTRDVSFLNGGIQIRLVPAGYAIDEILEMSQLRAAMRDRLLFLIATHPDGIGIRVFIACGEVSL
jgi:hypothetical protein